MNSTDKTAFTAIIAKTWRFYEKTPTAQTVADWFEVLEGFPLADIATAFKRHLTDPQTGQYPPPSPPVSFAAGFAEHAAPVM